MLSYRTFNANNADGDDYEMWRICERNFHIAISSEDRNLWILIDTRISAEKKNQASMSGSAIELRNGEKKKEIKRIESDQRR